MCASRKTSGGPSLRQIADRLGVNVSTVSRALGGDAGVGTERSEQIRRVARKMGYRPKPVRRRRTSTVGLLVATDEPGRPDDYFQQRLMVLVADEASRRGLHLHMELVPRGKRSASVPLVVEENRVDGVVLSGHPHASLCSRIRKLGVPGVVIHDSARRTGLDCMVIDVADATRTLVERLIALGCREFAYGTSDRRFPTVAARFDAFEAALAQHRIGRSSVRALDGLATGMKGGRDMVAALCAKSRMPDALLLQNDVMAIGAMYELTRYGKDIPEDVKVVGFDDTAMAAEIEPGLTSFSMGEREMVDRSLDLLSERIAGKESPAREVALPVRLVWRASSG